MFQKKTVNENMRHRMDSNTTFALTERIIPLSTIFHFKTITAWLGTAASKVLALILLPPTSRCDSTWLSF